MAAQQAEEEVLARAVALQAAAGNDGAAETEPLAEKLAREAMKRSRDSALNAISTKNMKFPQHEEASQARTRVRTDREYSFWGCLPEAQAGQTAGMPATTTSNTLAVRTPAASLTSLPAAKKGPTTYETPTAIVDVKRKKELLPSAKWHANWKLMRVISGHQGWVRCLAVDPSNQWFASGSVDRLIKIWDLASGTLKLTLTGHISPIRALCISERHPYLFSCAEDKMVKCWDLEQNKAIRAYHGHLSGVYCMALHPSQDILMTGGRDAVVRVWDMRTKKEVFTLSGHSNGVCSLLAQNGEPEIISGSMDTMVRLWDLRTGKCRQTLTHHKKSVRAMAAHPTASEFATCSTDNMKIWSLPTANFQRDMQHSKSVVNSCAIRTDADPESAQLVSATDTGLLEFFDWRSGQCFQRIEGLVQPGSLEAENGIFDLAFDKSGSRLLTAECDKTIKVYKEEVATD